MSARAVRVVKGSIRSKADYEFYLEADRVALLGIRTAALFKRPPLAFSSAIEIWKFQRLLRKAEFLKNCGKSIFNKISLSRTWHSYENKSVKLGYTIPPNVFGPGLSIAHRGTIVVHPDCRVGDNCRIHHGVTLGSGRNISNDSPTIGNNVFIGAGAVIIGPISIADGIAVGANSYVNKTFSEPNITIAGCPARKVSNKSSEDLWIRATEILKKNGSE